MSSPFDNQLTPPLSPSTSPFRSSGPNSSSNSSSSLSLPLQHLSLENPTGRHVRSSESPSPQESRPNRFSPKLTRMMEKLDEDTVMLGDDECMDSDAIRDSLARPTLPSRQPSYSKRHASVDTPREVPFSYPFYPDPISRSTTSSHAPSQINSSGIHPAATADDGPQRDRIDGLPVTHQDQPPAYENADANKSPSAHHRASRPLPPVPTDKPSVYSSMQSSSASDAGPSTDSSSDAANHASYQHQDISSQHNGPYNQPANALFPFGRPFSSPGNATQPMVPPGRFAPPNPSGPGWYDRSSTASLPLPTQTPYYTLPSVRSTDTNQEPAVPGPSSGALTWSPDPSPSGSNMRQHPHPLPSLPHERVLPSSASTVSYAPPPPPYTPSAFGGGGGGITRAMSDYSPSPPPTAIRAASPAPSMNPSRSLPPPAPPTILAPPPSPPGPERGIRAPHEPFLSHAPPPADSWIAVETMAREYNLVVRLPGFRRDGITLATRRRRILHLVADSWDANGGHFERRIAFGYDADLAQVRAEFDGELLRVIIPRRVPSITWYGEARE